MNDLKDYGITSNRWSITQADTMTVSGKEGFFLKKDEANYYLERRINGKCVGYKKWEYYHCMTSPTGVMTIKTLSKVDKGTITEVLNKLRFNIEVTKEIVNLITKESESFKL